MLTAILTDYELNRNLIPAEYLTAVQSIFRSGVSDHGAIHRCLPEATAGKYQWKCIFFLQYPSGHTIGQHHEWNEGAFSDQPLLKSGKKKAPQNARSDARTLKAEWILH